MYRHYDQVENLLEETLKTFGKVDVCSTMLQKGNFISQQKDYHNALDTIIDIVLKGSKIVR